MKYLGVDWGFIKIGLAVSEGEISSPWGVAIVQKNSLGKAVAKIVSIVKKERIDQVVIGKSTRDAKTVMLEVGMGRKVRKDDNAMAAAIILQRYLDEKP